MVVCEWDSKMSISALTNFSFVWFFSSKTNLTFSHLYKWMVGSRSFPFRAYFQVQTASCFREALPTTHSTAPPPEVAGRRLRKVGRSPSSARVFSGFSCLSEGTWRGSQDVTWLISPWSDPCKYYLQLVNKQLSILSLHSVIIRIFVVYGTNHYIDVYIIVYIHESKTHWRCSCQQGLCTPIKSKYLHFFCSLHSQCLKWGCKCIHLPCNKVLTYIMAFIAPWT